MDHEQRINMKFCLKLQKSAKETQEMLKLVMLQWPWRRFTSGSSDFVMVVNRLKTRSGRPSISKTQENVERVSEMIWSNSWLTIREISEDLNISYGSVQKHFSNRSEHEVSECEICSTCFDGRTKATAFVNFIGVVRSCRFRSKLFRKCHHGRWKLGPWLWSWD